MQESNWSISLWIPLIAVLIAQIVFIWKYYAEQKAKRKDEKRTAKLNRLNQQLSDLYGPLYALYETGEKQWLTFVDKYSNDPMPVPEFKRFFVEERDFESPNPEQLKEYRLWMKTTFMPNNIRMEEVIVNRAELIVGKGMPQCLLDLCAHVAANKPVMDRWEAEDFDEASEEDHKAGYRHPGFAIREYVRASFNVLKKEQELLLNGEKDDTDENDLEKQINHQIEVQRIDREMRYDEAERLLAASTPKLIGEGKFEYAEKSLDKIKSTEEIT